MAMLVSRETELAVLEKGSARRAKLGQATVDVDESTEVNMRSTEGRGQASIEATQGRPDAVCGELTSNGTTVTRMAMDRESELWVEQLRRGHPRRDQAVAKLHDVLVRIAYHELVRRGGQLGSNNKLGVLKRTAYGFTNSLNFEARGLLLCPPRPVL